MKRPSQTRSTPDPTSKDGIKHQAARAVIAQVESRLAEEEEREKLQKPAQIVVRTLIGLLLIAWIIIMSWIAIGALKKKEPVAQVRPGSLRKAHV